VPPRARRPGPRRVRGEGRSRGLTGNPGFAFAEHVIDGGRDRREPACGVCSGDDGVKAVGELLSEEAGRELSRLPPLVLHQRREERKVMAETFAAQPIHCLTPAPPPLPPPL